jgi:hypothetical protein
VNTDIKSIVWREYFGNPSVDGRIILKWALKKRDMDLILSGAGKDCGIRLFCTRCLTQTLMHAGCAVSALTAVMFSRTLLRGINLLD